jgi:hypothetical protein
MAQGGYRKPGSPAPVSGAGALSARTDGGPADKQAIRNLSNLPYGEGQEFQSIEGAAPMEAAPQPSMSAAPIREAAQQTPQGVPLQDFTTDSQTSHPVTAGIDMGPGPGSFAMPAAFAPGDKPLKSNPVVLKYLPDLMAAARTPNAPDSYREFVNYLARQV